MAVVQFDPGRTKTLTIPNGQTESDILDLGQGPANGPKSYRRWDMNIWNLNAALTGTVNVYVSLTPTNPGNFRKLNSGGSAISLPVDSVTSIVPIVARYMKLVSSSAEGATRTFDVAAVTINNER